jgi:hypothetical protein
MRDKLKKLVLYAVVAGFVALMLSVIIALVKKMPEQENC